MVIIMTQIRCLHMFAFTVLFVAKSNASLTTSFSRQRQFKMSYLLDVIPHESIKSVTLSSNKAGSQMSCGQMCFGKQECVTAIYSKDEKKCILLKSKLISIENYRTTTVQDRETKIIVLHAIDPCSPNPCFSQGRCRGKESGFNCSCAVDERGSLCEIKLSGTSCKEIKNKFAKYNPANGKYKLASLDGKESFTAYCDMVFDQGGWTQVAKVISDSKNATHAAYKEASNLKDFDATENYVMTSEFLQKFRNFSDFKQFRFECYSNVTKRKIHIKTKEKHTGIVDYFAGVNDARPGSCSTYTKYPDDNSYLSNACMEWRDAKWGARVNSNRISNLRMADQSMFIAGGVKYSFRKDHPGFCCDNRYEGVTTGDFWKIYVR